MPPGTIRQPATAQTAIRPRFWDAGRADSPGPLPQCPAGQLRLPGPLRARRREVVRFTADSLLLGWLRPISSWRDGSAEASTRTIIRKQGASWLSVVVCFLLFAC